MEAKAMTLLSPPLRESFDSLQLTRGQLSRLLAGDYGLDDVRGVNSLPTLTPFSRPIATPLGVMDGLIHVVHRRGPRP
jgi:hypothetical protein